MDSTLNVLFLAFHYLNDDEEMKSIEKMMTLLGFFKQFLTMNSDFTSFNCRIFLIKLILYKVIGLL